MKNLLEFNDFKQYKTTNLITEAAGTDDKYFENVKGNLAGAENTLIGSAFLKLFGFMKRKGMEAYLKYHLKSKLGKQYFNNILRYVARNSETIRPPKEKELFEVKKLQDGNKAVGDSIRVLFKKDENKGIKMFVVGATVTTHDGNMLEDGSYSMLYYVGSTFKVEGGIITKLDNGFSTTHQESIDINEQEDEQEDSTQSQNDIEYIKKELEDIAEGITADDDVVTDCNQIQEKIQEEYDNGALTQKKKAKYLHDLDAEIQSLKRLGLGELEEELKDDTLNTNQREEIERDKKVYSANLVEFTKLHMFIADLQIKKAQTTEPKPTTKTKPQAVIPESLSSYGDVLFEATNDVLTFKNTDKNTSNRKDVKTPKISDELEELSNKGMVVDFNDPEFYKQFEDEKIKTNVTNIILENKPDIVKIQLQAERIIGSSAKMKNSWEKMVQDVLGKYSKFMVVDKVNPITLKGSTSSVDGKEGEKKKEEADSKGSADMAAFDMAVGKIKTFNNIASKVSNENMKEVTEGDIGMFYASINGIKSLWVYQYNELNLTKGGKRVAYRILGYINGENQEKIKSNPEAITNIKEYVTSNFYNYFLNEKTIKTKDGNNFPLKGLYLFGKSTKFSFKTNNSASIGLLYYGDSLDLDDPKTYGIKLMDKDKSKNAYQLTNKTTHIESKKVIVKVIIEDAFGAWKIDRTKANELIDFNKITFNVLNDTYNNMINSILEIKGKNKK